MPTHSMPQSSAVRTTARTAAFMPGASPPLVSTPIRLIFFMGLSSCMFIRSVDAFLLASIILSAPDAVKKTLREARKKTNRCRIRPDVFIQNQGSSTLAKISTASSMRGLVWVAM